MDKMFLHTENLLICSKKYCEKLIEKNKEYLIKNRVKIEKLINDLAKNKITLQKYKVESNKIISNNVKSKSNIEEIKCKIKHCNKDYKRLILTIIEYKLKILKLKSQTNTAEYKREQKYHKLFSEKVIKYDSKLVSYLLNLMKIK